MSHYQHGVLIQSCSCGSTKIMAVRPGTDAEYGHPPDRFGLPDLSQKVVVQTPEVPCVAWCLPCWIGAFEVRAEVAPP